MKNLLIIFSLILTLLEGNAQERKDKFGEGLYRISYINVYNCKTEFQSFDTTITETKLNQLMSFMYHIGSKDRGMENEFKTYRTYDFTGKSDTKAKLVAFSKDQIKMFEKNVAKLIKTPIPSEFNDMKAELVRNHTVRLNFEKIFKNWYASGDDAKFRKQITEFYSDIYIAATLDKTLAIKDINDKWKYTYAELYDIVHAKKFSYDKLNDLQNKVMFDYKIEVVIDPKCTKS